MKKILIGIILIGTLFAIGSWFLSKLPPANPQTYFVTGDGLDFRRFQTGIYPWQELMTLDKVIERQRFRWMIFTNEAPALITDNAVIGDQVEVYSVEIQSMDGGGKSDHIRLARKVGTTGTNNIP